MTDQKPQNDPGPAGSRIAGGLVVCLPQGQSLADWRSAGTLDREWAVHSALLERFDRVVVVTYGGADDLTVAPDLSSEQMAVSVVCNEAGQPVPMYEATAVHRVADLTDGCATAIVKADQMAGCDLARPITVKLRDRGVDARLVARTGFHWSRFIARECGPDSQAAIEAGDSEARICEMADLILSTDDHALDDLAWRYRLDRSRAIKAPDCILADVDPSLSRDPRRLVSVGSLIEQSRMDLIVQAVAQLGEPLKSEITLELIGEGPERANLEAMAQELGVKLEIAPRSNHKDVMDAIGRAAAMVQAEDHVGDPRFIFEAQAIGTTCVVTETLGLGATVEHGVTGLKCPQEPAAIAHMIMGVCEDESWSEALSQAGARTVRARYGVERAASALANAYQIAMASEARVAA